MIYERPCPARLDEVDGFVCLDEQVPSRVIRCYRQEGHAGPHQSVGWEQLSAEDEARG